MVSKDCTNIRKQQVLDIGYKYCNYVANQLDKENQGWNNYDYV